MAAKGEIHLGTAIDTLEIMTAFGRRLSIEDVEISKSERTASGKLVKDVWAVPRKITLAYEMIDGDELDKFITYYQMHCELVLRIYKGPTTYDDYTVLMEPISKERVLLLGNGLWGNVTIEFNEVNRAL